MKNICQQMLFKCFMYTVYQTFHDECLKKISSTRKRLLTQNIGFKQVFKMFCKCFNHFKTFLMFTGFMAMLKLYLFLNLWVILVCYLIYVNLWRVFIRVYHFVVILLGRKTTN